MKFQIKTNNGSIEVETEKPYMENSKCRGCGKEIFWAKTKGVKNMPISMLGNGDLVCHFYDCSKANNFRNNKKQ